MIYKTGSLFDTESLCIGHGVNTQGVMGAGIAKTFKKNWPAMFEAYREACKTEELAAGGCFVWTDWEDDTVPIIFNMASQELPGANAELSLVRYSAYIAATSMAAMEFDTLAIPRIGCGIGGLQWDDVAENLEFIEAITGIEFEVWTPPLQLVKD